MRTSTKFVTNISLVFFGLLIAALLLEVLVRVFLQPHSYTNFYEAHEQFGQFFKPGQKGYYIEMGHNTYIEINSRGLRDEEHSYEKSRKVFRVLVLGDSFGAAFQVPLEDTFHKVTQRLLNQMKAGNKYKIINGSFPGWGTSNELHKN